MPVSKCENCGHKERWYWPDAFLKFGFGNGARKERTWIVESVLDDAGYEVQVMKWLNHNTVIVSIKDGGKELIPTNDPKFTFGYDSPRFYLPEEVTKLLDEKLSF